MSTGIAKSICRTLPLPQPPASVSAVRIAALRSEAGAPETSAVQGCAPRKRPPPSVGTVADGERRARRRCAARHEGDDGDGAGQRHAEPSRHAVGR